MVGWWPPAPGWWLLAVLFLLGLALVGFLLWRRYRRNAYRRIAQRQLLAIRAQYREDGDASRCLAAANALLKSAAMIAYPGRRLAPASGDQWLAVINEALPPAYRLERSYLAALYGSGQHDPQVEEILTAASMWIRRHKGLAA
jgi:hypothetical protein